MRLVKDGSSTYLLLGPIGNKLLEMGVSRRSSPSDGFDLSWRFRTRCDHAGIKCFVKLWSWRFLEWSLHDIRHWNDGAGRFYAEDEYQQVLNTPLDDP